jgi:hypothetical protein
VTVDSEHDDEPSETYMAGNFLIEEFCLLGYNAVRSVENQSMFQGNIPPPSSGSKNKHWLLPVSCWFLAWLIL